MSFPGFDWISEKIAHGAYAEAEPVLTDFITRQPRNAHALQFLALICSQTGRANMATIQLKRAISLEPASPALRYNLANVLQILGNQTDALKMYKDVLRIDPRYYKAWLGISQCHLADNDSQTAEHAAKKGIELQPNWPEIYVALASAQEQMGKLPEALHTLKSASFQFPHHKVIGSNYLLMLLHQCCSKDELIDEHRRIIQRSLFHLDETDQKSRSVNPEKKMLIKSSGKAANQFTSARERRVIAILSGDLRTHSVAYFAKALFEYRPEHVELHVFNTHPETENDSERNYFQNRATVWHSVAGLSSSKIADAICATGAEILLELSGHTAFNRLDVLAHRPTPIVVTALGYPHSLMHPNVNYRLTDRICEPEGVFVGSERPLYMAPSFLCFTPPERNLDCEFSSDEVPFTFASSNAASKITPEMIGCWIKILKSAPQARLIVKGKGTEDRQWRSNFKQLWAKAGMQKSQLKFLDYRIDRMQHLNDYREIDVVLDTFPYNGTTTTCEALWMGVPVLSMMGQTHVSRVGRTILGAMHLDGWVEETINAYIDHAINLASRKEELRKGRAEVRQKFLDSALCQRRAYSTAFFDTILNL
ncbi:MAG: tetratricopeptide repeat protein [Bacteroidetes bacterium]|nr:tetratricopeptide repeat protein [Bacteroidota bacterium]